MLGIEEREDMWNCGFRRSMIEEPRIQDAVIRNFRITAAYSKAYNNLQYK